MYWPCSNPSELQRSVANVQTKEAAPVSETVDDFPRLTDPHRKALLAHC